MASNKKLDWLELGRGIAAIGVLLDHGSEVGFPSSLSFVYSFGDWGVCFFFVLSGFIIHHIHAKDIGQPARAANFVFRRLLRIIPTYWLILTVALLIRNFVGNPNYAVEINTAYLLKNYFLLPDGQLFISPAWTLRHEFLFYGLFFTLIINRRVGLAAFVAWIAYVGFHIYNVGTGDGRDHPITETLGSYRNLFFFAGLMVSHLYSRNRLGWLTVATAICTIAASFSGSFAALLFTGCTFLVSSGALLSSHGISATPLALWIGSLSYPLYLVHRMCFLVAHGLLRRFGIDHQWLIHFTLGAIIAVIAAQIIHSYFERFVLSLRLRRNEREAVPTAGQSSPQIASLNK